MEANELLLAMEVKGLLLLGIGVVVLAAGVSLAVLRWKWRRKQLRSANTGEAGDRQSDRGPARM